MMNTSIYWKQSYKYITSKQNLNVEAVTWKYGQLIFSRVAGMG